MRTLTDTCENLADFVDCANLSGSNRAFGVVKTYCIQAAQKPRRGIHRAAKPIYRTQVGRDAVWQIARGESSQCGDPPRRCASNYL